MKQSRKRNVPDDDNRNELWPEPDALELWRYFGSAGTTYKNTMVTVNSLLLGFSAGIIGYFGANLVAFETFKVTQPFLGIGLAALGIVISSVAGYVSLLYGGYSNWNWAKAHDIARKLAQRFPKSNWSELKPENSRAALQKWTSGKPSYSLYTIAMKLGRPRDYTKQLAPIFPLFTWLALGFGVVHLLVFLWSVWSL